MSSPETSGRGDLILLDPSRPKKNCPKYGIIWILLTSSQKKRNFLLLNTSSQNQKNTKTKKTIEFLLEVGQRTESLKERKTNSWNKDSHIRRETIMVSSKGSHVLTPEVFRKSENTCLLGLVNSSMDWYGVLFVCLSCVALHQIIGKMLMQPMTKKMVFGGQNPHSQ